MKKNYEALMNEALETLKNDGEIFVDMVNELDSWDGFADGFRCYPMWEIDDLFCDCKVSEFLDKLAPGFNHTDEYMVDTIYGLDSTDDIESVYRDHVDEGELLDRIIENANHIYFSDSDFEDLIDSIINYEEEEEEEDYDEDEERAGLLDRVAAAVEEIGKAAQPEATTGTVTA